MFAYIALGANKNSQYGPPKQSIKRALKLLDQYPLKLLKVSPLYQSQSINPNQNDYINGVCLVQTALGPLPLLRRLKQIERDFGRRGKAPRWAPRALDLDLIDYEGLNIKFMPAAKGSHMDRPSLLTLPHPFMHKRLFVLQPLMDIAPHWRHQQLFMSPSALIKQNCRGQSLVKL